MNQGKCPKCEAVVANVLIEQVPASIGAQNYNAISYLCSKCQTVLSVQLDPLEIKSDTINLLRDHPPR